jgi:hypothetical protein
MVLSFTCPNAIGVQMAPFGGVSELKEIRGRTASTAAAGAAAERLIELHLIYKTTRLRRRLHRSVEAMPSADYSNLDRLKRVGTAPTGRNPSIASTSDKIGYVKTR